MSDSLQVWLDADFLTDRHQIGTLTLWIAKFPAKDDERDIGAWESLAHGLAQRTGIVVPPAKIKTFGGEFHTFCVKRFDRVGNVRRFYA